MRENDAAQAEALYRELIGNGAGEPPQNVAVVGAGLTGSTCTRILHEHGVSVDVFERGPEAGGRTVTHRVERGGRRFSFDTGAQYFTVRDERFARVLDRWQQRGVAAKWEGRFAAIERGEITPKESNPDRFVGVPGMGRLGGHLLAPLEPEFGTKVALVEKTGNRWTLRSTKGDALGVYDRLVMALPPGPALNLLGDRSPTLSEQCRRVRMQPTWTLLLGLEHPFESGFDGAFVNDHLVDWVARNRSKPGRRGGEAWVVHSSHDWAMEHFPLDRQEVADRLEKVFWKLVGQSGADHGVRYRSAHRWRYAEADSSLDCGYLCDPDRGIVVAGDWLNGSRIEGAFLSGCRAAAQTLGSPD